MHTNRTEVRDGKTFKVTVIPPGQRKIELDLERLYRTKYPFRAYINGQPVVVWPDWIEREESPQPSLI